MYKRILLPVIAFMLICFAHAQVGKVYTSIDEALKTPNEVFVLDLYFQDLTSLPESIGMLKNLQKLELSGNQLTSLPETFGQMEKLQWLSLKGNSIKKLPESFENLKSLTELNIVYTDISSADQAKLKKLFPDCAILY